MCCSDMLHDVLLHDALQVFHSLLKAHAVEARAVVRQALEILTPAMPGRMEDGNVCISLKSVNQSVKTHSYSTISQDMSVRYACCCIFVYYTS